MHDRHLHTLIAIRWGDPLRRGAGMPLILDYLEERGLIRVAINRTRTPPEWELTPLGSQFLDQVVRRSADLLNPRKDPAPCPRNETN